MSPERPGSRRASIASPIKPYSKARTNTISHKNETAELEITQTDIIASKPGFPSYAQYKSIETAYLKSLSPKRQDKALISQVMFDRIWDVLHNPDTPKETAQFRFWSRRSFTLAKLSSLNVDPDVLSRQPSQTVMLHENLLVAVQEQIYDILCYNHGITNHGGRDKTYASLRKHYTCIPKELISQFTKACPTCLMKKCGLPNVVTVDTEGSSNQDQPVLPTLRDFLRNLAAQDGIAYEDGEKDWHLASFPRSTAEKLDRKANQSAPTHAGPSNSGPSSAAMHRLASLPMSREVSLYQGLPNGWQFHSDYATAHAEFVKSKDDPALPGLKTREKRPRVPSIAPMIAANVLARGMVPTSEEIMHRDTLPPVNTFTWCNSTADSLPANLQPLRVSLPDKLNEDYLPQIDPALLVFSDSSSQLLSVPATASSTYAYRASPLGTESPILGNPPPSESTTRSSPCQVQTGLRPSTSIRRAAAPPSINLESLSSQKTIQAFLATRDTAGLSPESPAECPSVSPTSSVGSYSSQLSAFPMTTTSSASTTNSVPPTPVDDVAGCSVSQLSKEMTESAVKEKPGLNIEPVLHDTIEVVA